MMTSSTTSARDRHVYGCPFCNYMGVISDVFTAHDAKTSIINFMDYKQVLKYYGPQATLYVVFMREYLKWLRLPALLGMVAWVI